MSLLIVTDSITGTQDCRAVISMSVGTHKSTPNSLYGFCETLAACCKMMLMSGKCIATHWYAICHCSVTIALLFPPICWIKDCFLTCLFVIADWLKMYKLCTCVCVCVAGSNWKVRGWCFPLSL